MKDTLTALLEQSEELTKEVELELSSRLKGIKFKVVPVSGKDFTDLKQSCRTMKNGIMTFNDSKFNEQIICKCCTQPTFNDEKSLTQSGCKTPSELINKVLKAGEIVDLVNHITSLSGFESPDKDK